MKQGWEIVSIGSICNIKTGKLDANASSEDGAYPFFTCSKEELRIDNYAYDCECVLIAGNGDLNVKYYNGKFNAYQRTYIISLKEGTNKVLVKYIYKFFEKYIERLRQVSVGGVIKYIKLGDLTTAQLPVPPIAEQEKIVAELDCLSGIIEKKKQQLKELDNLAQSIFYEMFVRESKNWEKMKLIDIYKFIDYRGKTPTKISEGIPLITARNIRRGYIDYSVKEYISEEEFAGRQSRGIAQKGDLLFTTEAPMGYVAIADLEVFSTGQRLITFQKKRTIDVNNTYVLHYLLSDEFQMELNNQATGATVKGIKGSKLEQMLIDCPPMQLQKDFASKIESIEKQKELIAQSIKETETLFNSRMDYYFN